MKKHLKKLLQYLRKSLAKVLPFCLKVSSRIFIVTTPFYTPMMTWIEARKNKREFLEWERKKISIPPRHLAKKIIQFSPSRCGSTLVFKILKEIFPDRIIHKQHHFTFEDLICPVVVTYRHPLDSIASYLQVLEYKKTMMRLIKLQKTRTLMLNDVMKLKNNPNVLMLRYEDFVYDFELIYDELEKFFDIEIPVATRNRLTKKYHISSIEKKIKEMSHYYEVSKSGHYKGTSWYTKHISAYKGKSFYYQEFFQEGEIAYLTHVYKRFIVGLGYM